MTEGRVLVVDDSALSRRTVLDPLQAAGFEVVEAEDGEAGLEAFDADEPLAVLLDFQMPGMDGLEVLEALRERADKTPVIAMTAHESDETARAFLEAGASDFLAKGPLLGVRVVNAIERALLLADPSAPSTLDSPARVLLVEDSAVARQVTEGMLAEGPFPVDVAEAEDGEEGLAMAREGGFDVLLVDHQLPDTDGPEVLEALRDEGIEVPALAVTGTLDPDVAERFLEAGAYDVWSKDGESPLRLQVTVNRLARMNRARSA